MSPEQLRQRAESALDRGDRISALAALETAVRANPEDSESHLQLGRLLWSWGSPEAARQAFNAAAVLDADCAEAQEALARLPPRPVQPVEFGVGDVICGATQRYRVTGIGEGGFSVVYLVEAEGDHEGERLALKTFRAHAAWDKDSRARVYHEAAAWLALPPHPHIVTAKKFEVVDDVPYLVLEQVDGHALTHHLSVRPLSLLRCLDYGIQICDAMAFLTRWGRHAHGDLTPANVLVRPDGRVQLTDFGGAAAAGEAEVVRYDLALLRPETARRYVTYPGTAGYMPPEWAATGRRTQRGDLYSFGVLLAVMLGQRLESAVRAVHAVTRQSGHDPHEGEELLQWPPELIQLVRRLTDYSPRRRPASFRTVRKELAALHRQLAPDGTHRTHPAGAAPRSTGRAVPSTPAERAVRYRDRGASFYALRSYRTSYRLLNAALWLDRHDPVSWALTARLRWTLGQQDIAQSSATRAVQLVGRDHNAALAVAEALIAMEDFTRAATVLRPLLAEPKHAASACALLCRAAAVDGQWQDCAKWADHAWGHGSRSLHLRATKALALHFCGCTDDALDAAADVIRQRPLIRLAWLVRCLAQLAHGDLTGAEEAFARVRDLSTVFDASAWALRGRIAAEHGSHDEAGRSVVEARAALSEAEALDRHIASALLTEGEWTEHALERSRAVGDLTAQAVSQVRAGPLHHAQALELISRAAEIDPSSVHVADSVCIVVRELGGLLQATAVARSHFSGHSLERVLKTLSSPRAIRPVDIL
ncbi:protein kinase domain-containing protein [Streptomyces sp. KR55]|uniref:protein kinase domain-containing protein n=1 Tax=Streptomyces sp. KR55 TaxID=3457425 RepID=UPI003FD1689C